MTKRKRQISFREGQAEENGFMLWIYPPKDKRIDKDFFKTPNYTANHNYKFSILDWLFTGIVLIIYLCMLNFLLNPSNIFIKLLCYAMIFISLLYTPAMSYIFRNKHIREWHACEQQTANLLDSGKEINMKNLKRASRIRKGCGTKMACQYFFSFIYCVMVYYVCYGCIKIASIQNLSQYWFILTMMLMIFWRLYYLIMATMFSPLTQLFVTTAKPSEEKLKQALELAKEIEEIVN